MRKFLLVLLILGLIGGGCYYWYFSSEGEVAPQPRAVVDPLQYVDPLIGSGEHGHVFVGANVPFGAVQLGLTNITTGWDWCSGYHISDSTHIGFAHTHLSGTGIGDKGDILFMPYTGRLAGRTKERYVSTFRRENEVASAGYYRVLEDRYNVLAELTASTHIGYHRYTYPTVGDQKILINLKQGIGWDGYKLGEVTQTSDTTIVGYRLSRGWAEDDRVYFSAAFSAPIKSLVWDKRNAVALLEFTNTSDTLTSRVAISGVDIDGATLNLHAEGYVPFNQAVSRAQDQWRTQLGRLEAYSHKPERLRTFYTALYHAMFYPSVFNDTDGRYRGADGQIHTAKEGQTIYTNFSLWDTYRAAHPLYTIIAPERVPDMINSMLNIYDQQGKLPIWHLAGNETNCMTGVSSVQVVGDAVLKNFGGIDPERALRAMADYANLDERGLAIIRKKGYYPADKDAESVARALEYCISDAAVARVAQKLGKTDLAEKFTNRSQSYRHYYDKTDHFIKGVLSNGEFRKPFDPAHSTHRADDFCEGNAWQYTWMVPHDFPGLIEIMGGRRRAEERLDLTFSTPYVPAKDASPDISGMIGQVAHGNEPSHSTAFAYTAMGRPHKTAKIVRHILDSLYLDTPEGISGNEDMGQMSAWYILNAMGVYQPDPSLGTLVFGSPIMDSVFIALPGGQELAIRTLNLTDQNYAIESAELSGSALGGHISYEQLMAGGDLTFTLMVPAAAAN